MFFSFMASLHHKNIVQTYTIVFAMNLVHYNNNQHIPDGDAPGVDWIGGSGWAEISAGDEHVCRVG